MRGPGIFSFVTFDLDINLCTIIWVQLLVIRVQSSVSIFAPKRSS